jgi:hypothetical protein
MSRARSARPAVLLVLALAVALLASRCSAPDGLGVVVCSVVDQVSPLASARTLWARTPEPDGFVDSYANAAEDDDNYVYEVEGFDEEGEPHVVTIILFGRRASGEGYLRIEARGGSGEHYDRVPEDAVPTAVLEALKATAPA